MLEEIDHKAAGRGRDFSKPRAVDMFYDEI
jgi:hypothetical protein